jgi:cytochrome b pre-mRNA-processing protein 3
MTMGLFSRRNRSPVPQQIYGAVVAQARMPEFYSVLSIPDSVTGRFDMLTLHMFLLGHRLARENAPLARQLSQDVFDEFTDGLDDALRAIGIGDTSVPKRKQAMVRGYYAQIEEFSPPIDAKDWPLLAERFCHRFLAGEKRAEATRLADYCRRAVDLLAALELEKLLAGKLAWPETRDI